MKAIVTVGISGSGKSTWADEYVRNRSDWYVIERDMIRFPTGIKDWPNWKWKKEKEVTSSQWEYISRHALAGHNIIISDTNLNKERRILMIEKLETMGFDVEVKFFDVSLKDAINRDLNRQGSVGPDVVLDQWLKLNRLEYVKSVDGELAYIVDIDGTVANNDGHRSFFEWSKVGDDKVHNHIMNMVKALNSAGYAIVFLSGRDEVCRPETEEWLNNHFGSDYELFMRPKGSMLRDSIVKEDLFFEHIHGFYNVQAVIDDRPQVIKECWMRLGIPVICVGNPYKDK